MKKKVTEEPILVMPDFNKPFQVKCDASEEAIGVVLSWEDRLVVYFSEMLNDTKRKYYSYDKEFYGSCASIEKVEALLDV